MLSSLFLFTSTRAVHPPMQDFSNSNVMSNRAPPHNLDAEKSALGCVLLKPSCFDEVAMNVTPDDFFLPGHREILDSMVTIDRRRQAIDVISLGDELKTRGALPRLEG